MQNNLTHTKKKLALIFAGLVFLLAFILEISYFSFKYYNTNLQEKNKFIHITNQFIYNIEKNPYFINSIINKNFRDIKWRQGQWW